MIDPQVQMVLNQLEATRVPAFNLLTPAMARKVNQLLGKILHVAEPVNNVLDDEIATSAGALRVRTYRPLGTVRGLVVFYHGGGWVLGDLETTDSCARLLAARTSCCVVSVDYRLAPEHPFPAAVEDAYAAYRWCADRRMEIAGANVPLIVAGDSAGANLAAVCSLRARDEGRHDIAMQLLFYPVVDATFDTASYREYAQGPLVTRALMAWFFDLYVPDARMRTDARVAPLRARQFNGLPATLIQTAQYDLLRDEGEAYAGLLKAAGVDVTLQRRDGLVHGYLHLTARVAAANRALDDAAQAVTSICMRAASHA